MDRNLAAETAERHHNQLPTPEARRAYAKRMIDAMEQGAEALRRVAKALRQDPDTMLARAFSPNITGMLPETLAVVELTHHDNSAHNGRSYFTVKGKAIVDGSRFNEIGFHAVVTSHDEVIPLQDNLIGV